MPETTTAKKLTFMQKMLELQKRVEPITKDSVNPHFKNRYFDINTLLQVVKPHLNDLGLVLMQPLSMEEGKQVLVTKIEDTESEGYSSCKIALPEIEDPQKVGSAITYYRRYSLQSLLGLQAEDDDGNTASVSTTKTATAPAPGMPSKCPKCGAGVKISSKTNQPYCADMCWKKGDTKNTFEKAFNAPTVTKEESAKAFEVDEAIPF